MKQLKPNFFIIGAPKCGTTSLSVYLSEHREIVMSHPKEPHYFSTDIENGRMTDQSKYLSKIKPLLLLVMPRRFTSIPKMQLKTLWSLILMRNLL